MHASNHRLNRTSIGQLAHVVKGVDHSRNERSPAARRFLHPLRNRPIGRPATHPASNMPRRCRTCLKGRSKSLINGTRPVVINPSAILAGPSEVSISMVGFRSALRAGNGIPISRGGPSWLLAYFFSRASGWNITRTGLVPLQGIRKTSRVIEVTVAENDRVYAICSEIQSSEIALEHPALSRVEENTPAVQLEPVGQAVFGKKAHSMGSVFRQQLLFSVPGAWRSTVPCQRTYQLREPRSGRPR